VYPHNRILAVVAATLILGCNSAEKRAAERDAKLAQEIARVESSLSASEKGKLPAEMQEMPKAYREALGRARTAKSPELRLYRLREAVVGAELLEVFLAHPDASGTDLAPLTKFWNERRAAFARKPEPVRGPLLHRALAEAATNRAQILFRASLPYAKVSSPFAGVYYLAEAEGNRRFAELVASLPVVNEDEPLPRADRVEAALQALEQETLNTFAGEPTAPKMIPVSAKLKESRELLDRQFVSGAALSLLEARVRYSGGNAETVPASLNALASERAPLAAKKVLPASVTVTLVRWPYT
jgi:hypothetical protein